MATSPPLRPEPTDFDLNRLIAHVWQERVRLLGLALAAGLITLGIAFLLPKWYRAEATILPPGDSSLRSVLSLGNNALTQFPVFGLVADFFTTADVFKAVLESRRIQNAIVDRFDLQAVYKLKSREKTLKALEGRYDVKIAGDGTIVVTVDDRDPRRAARMATAFLEELDRYNIHNRNSRAQRTRQFLERRVHEADSLLRVAEGALKTYQELRHTIVPTSVSSPGVRAAADLVTRKTALEVRLGVLRTHLREDSDEIQQAKTELEQLEARIATLPKLQGDLARLLRDQKIQEQVYALLTAELEQARIRETLDAPTVQIIDRALPPERPLWPKVATMAILAALLALIGGVAWLGFQDRRPLLPPGLRLAFGPSRTGALRSNP